MFGYLKELFQKHKKKIVVTSALAIGTYTVTKLIRWKYEEWENQKVEEYALLAKKQYHYESNQRTCTMTFFSFLPDLRNTIAEYLDTESLLDVLKLNPANKIEIWEQLKVLSVTRVICSVVSSVILLVLLKVQLNIIGGYLFIKSQETDTPTSIETDLGKVQLDYMNNIRYFIEEKLPELIADCTKKSQDGLKNISLKEKISHAKLNTLLKDVMDGLNCDCSSNERHYLCKYFVDSQWIEEEEGKDEMYLKMTSETIDLLEGNDCSMVIDQCLHSGFEHVMDSIKGSFLGNEDPEAIVSLEDCAHSSFYKQIDLPFAKIIPILNGQLNEVFKVEANGFFDVLFAQEHLRSFSHNIYEAFSNKY